jgi:hypothetical protein
MRLLTIFAFLFVLLCASVVAAQSVSAAGAWDGTMKSPLGERPIHFDLKQDGENVSGTVKGRAGDLPIAGTVSGKDIKLHYTIKFQDNDMVITLKGAMDATSMKGSADFGGQSEGEFSVKRASDAVATAPKPAASTAAATDISGVWAFQVETSQGTGSPTFTFKQDGEKLTGQYKGAFGEAPLTGTVKDVKVDFVVKVEAQGQQFTLTYTGTIEKDGTMKGTAELGEIGSAKWTAKRQ